MLVGGSCGLAVHAALEVAHDLDESALIVVILPDGGRAYLSKIFNDAWMDSYGFLERAEDKTVGDVLHAKDAAGEMPPFVVVSPGQTVREAIALLHEHSVSQLPVVEESDIVGSVGERGLLRRTFANPSTMDSVIVEVMEEPFPAVSTERLGAGGGRAARRRARRDHGDGRRPAARHPHARGPAGVAGHMTEFATRCVHAGLTPDPSYGSIIPAIHASSTYVQPAPGEFVGRLRLLAERQPDSRGAGDGAG